MKRFSGFVLCVLLLGASVAAAQDALPADNGLSTYHSAPAYRESESHPLRIIAYVLHPIGWVLREGIFRPLSYFASSTPTRRSVMGYRDPYDFRDPMCSKFRDTDTVPECTKVSPFNYETTGTPPEAAEDEPAVAETARQVYFPNVNFDFDKRALNELGRGRVKQIASLLAEDGNVHVVLQGNTDYLGSEQYNEKLGLDRAEAVKAELIQLGTAPQRLSTVTFGETQPLFPEQEDWARALNRRVEVHLDEAKKPEAPEAIAQ